MKEENSKGKQQYNIEKENEEMLNVLIKEIMEDSASTKFLLDFIRQIREYKNKIYELKMNLGDTITEAYEVKNDMKIKRVQNNRLYCIEENVKNMRFPENTSNIDVTRILREEKNILRATHIFNYYEEQITFWQEMNLKKAKEESTQEHYFE